MNTTNQPTLLFHDYETWGVSPQKDHPSQFAAIRTDLDLNEIGSPENFYCQVANDYLPHPVASLLTGISPLQANRDGYCEAEFAGKIQRIMSEPQTCVVGYNSIRFDDEVTRYTFYRSFIDPYAREWQNGNSRWDIIDLVRTCYALRPDGIIWPEKDDGSPSFKLEQLTAANGISHADAHDALSDVRATIALARLVKQAQPKLYEYLFSLRDKRKVLNQLDLINHTPLVHISSKLPARQGCCTLIMPLCMHPTNKNAIIVLNLQLDPSPLFELDAPALLEKLYTASENLAPGEDRLPIKLIHINKCPAIAPLATLSDERAAQLGIDKQRCLAHWQSLKQNLHIMQKLQDMYEISRNDAPLDPDYALYTGGFFSDSDRYKMEQIRQLPPAQLAGKDWQFDDPRLPIMLFRYRARNYPESLSYDELQRWQQHRQLRLVDSQGQYGLNLTNYMNELALLAEQYQHDAGKMRLLRDLQSYGANL